MQTEPAGADAMAGFYVTYCKQRPAHVGSALSSRIVGGRFGLFLGQYSQNVKFLPVIFKGAVSRDFYVFFSLIETHLGP